MFIYNSSVLDVFCLYTWHSFFTVRPCFTHFFFTGRPRLTQAGLPSRRGGLTSHRQTSHREAFLTQRPFLTQRGPTSHREASPHTERAPPHTESSHRQTSCRHAFLQRKASPQTGKLYTGRPRLACLFQKKQTNELREENPNPLGVQKCLSLLCIFITKMHFSITHGQPHTRPLFRTHPSK